MEETVYGPDSRLRRPGVLLASILRDIRSAFPLAWRLLLRNLRAQYRQTVLGYVWAFIPPLATALVWVVLRNQRVVDFGDVAAPYPVFVLSGMVLWLVFVDALQAPLRVVSGSARILTSMRFPREALVFTALGEVLFAFLMRGVLLFVLLGVFGIWPHLGMAYSLLSVFSLLLLGSGIGLILTPLGLLYHDVGRALSITTHFWLYLTPVIYPALRTYPGNLLTWLNPVSPAVLAGRDWLLWGHTDSLLAFGVVSGIGLVLFLLGLAMYHLAIPILIERMNA